jgi:hypothetical protein
MQAYLQQRFALDRLITLAAGQRQLEKLTVEDREIFDRAQAPKPWKTTLAYLATVNL